MARALLARLDVVTRERDEAQAAFESAHDIANREAGARLVAEADRDRYRAALEQIERMAGAAGSGEIPALVLAQFARSALVSGQPAAEGEQ